MATRNEVMSIPAPPFTKSWHPFSHADVIRSIHIGAEVNNLEITSERYDMTGGGANMFASYTVEGDYLNPNPDASYQIGFRNSTAKLMAIGITVGTNVFVCSNMCFSGEYITFRKHTSGLDLDELYSIAIGAVKTIKYRLNDMMKWQESLRRYYLPPNQIKNLTYDAMDLGVFAPSKFRTFQKSFEEESSTHGRNLYAWHGAGTRTLRENSLSMVSNRTPILNSIADDYLLREAA
jgi:hypothetical protein